MSRRLDHAELLVRQEIVAPPMPRACTDRGFELPTGIYVAMAAMFLGFVGVLSFAFRNPEMAVPFGVFVAFIAAFFAVPAMFVRTTPADGRTPALGWSRFMEQGIPTATGHAGGREAAVLVLLLPVLIFGWAIAVAVIAALV
jgi:hypothetical protein